MEILHFTDMILFEAHFINCFKTCKTNSFNSKYLLKDYYPYRH
jgi:hypothetical protein